jgi:hypothetical protein
MSKSAVPGKSKMRFPGPALASPCQSPAANGATRAKATALAKNIAQLGLGPTRSTRPLPSCRRQAASVRTVLASSRPAISLSSVARRLCASGGAGTEGVLLRRRCSWSMMDWHSKTHSPQIYLRAEREGFEPSLKSLRKALSLRNAAHKTARWSQTHPPSTRAWPASSTLGRPSPSRSAGPCSP